MAPHPPTPAHKQHKQVRNAHADADADSYADADAETDSDADADAAAADDDIDADDKCIIFCSVWNNACSINERLIIMVYSFFTITVFAQTTQHSILITF